MMKLKIYFTDIMLEPIENVFFSQINHMPSKNLHAQCANCNTLHTASELSMPLMLANQSACKMYHSITQSNLCYSSAASSSAGGAAEFAFPWSCFINISLLSEKFLLSVCRSYLLHTATFGYAINRKVHEDLWWRIIAHPFVCSHFLKKVSAIHITLIFTGHYNSWLEGEWNRLHIEEDVRL